MLVFKSAHEINCRTARWLVFALSFPSAPHEITKNQPWKGPLSKLEIMDAKRVPLSHAPTAQFTLHREEFKKNEDLRLVKHFADWLSKVSGRSVTEENFEQDLLDGIALCTLMSKIKGSGMGYFHGTKSNVASLDAFKSKENLVSFQMSVKNLNLPTSFGTEDLEKGNISRVVSTLVFLAHTAHAQGVTVESMDKEILEKVGEVDEALKGELSWFQQLMIKLGLEEWIQSFNAEALKAYIATLRANLEARVQSQRVLLKQHSDKLIDKLPEAIKTKITAN